MKSISSMFFAVVAIASFQQTYGLGGLSKVGSWAESITQNALQADGVRIRSKLTSLEGLNIGSETDASFCQSKSEEFERVGPAKIKYVGCHKKWFSINYELDFSIEDLGSLIMVLTCNDKPIRTSLAASFGATTNSVHSSYFEILYPGDIIEIKARKAPNVPRGVRAVVFNAMIQFVELSPGNCGSEDCH